MKTLFAGGGFPFPQARANPFNCKMCEYFPSSVTIVMRFRGWRVIVDQSDRQKIERAFPF